MSHKPKCQQTGMIRSSRQSDVPDDNDLQRMIDYIEYNSEEGILTYKTTVGGRVKGSKVGWVNGEGYLKLQVNGKQRAYQNVCWFLYYGVWPRGLVDHINRDPGDNRISNLRLATPNQNTVNRSYSSIGSSNYRGVYKNDAGNWRVICCGKYLGTFRSKHEAAMIYNIYMETNYYGYADYNKVF